jgi:hypothetical protein
LGTLPLGLLMIMHTRHVGSYGLAAPSLNTGLCPPIHCSHSVFLNDYAHETCGVLWTSVLSFATPTASQLPRGVLQHKRCPTASGISCLTSTSIPPTKVTVASRSTPICLISTQYRGLPPTPPRDNPCCSVVPGRRRVDTSAPPDLTHLSAQLCLLGAMVVVADDNAAVVRKRIEQYEGGGGRRRCT